VTLAAALGGGYALFLSLFVGALFGEHYRRHGERPVAAARRAYQWHVRDDVRQDIQTISGYGVREWAHTAVTTALMPAIVARTVIHTVAYFVANPRGKPAVHVPRLFASPLTPRPAWNDLSARVVAFLIVIEYGRTMWATWAAAVDSTLVAVYVGANATLLVADLPAGIVNQLHRYVTHNA
jgi:hypothetical protein